MSIRDKHPDTRPTKATWRKGVPSLIMQSYPSSRRERHNAIGVEGERNVAKGFARMFGDRRVETGGGFSSTGSNARPDVLVKVSPNPIAVEVKSVAMFAVINQKRKTRDDGTPYKVPQIRKMPRMGWAKGYIWSWHVLTQYAVNRCMHRMVVIEWRREYNSRTYGDPGYTYFAGHKVDQLIERTLERKPEAMTFHFSMYDAMQHGETLKFEKGEIPKLINSLGTVCSPQQQLSGEM